MSNASHPFDNPYQSPALAVEVASLATPASPDWKTIARRWERLRLLYNFLVFLAGAAPLVLVITRHGLAPLIPALLYAVGANVMYLLGPIGEMYINWICDVCENVTPEWILRIIRSFFPTAFFFFIGAAVSVLLTFLVGMAIALEP